MDHTTTSHARRACVSVHCYHIATTSAAYARTSGLGWPTKDPNGRTLQGLSPAHAVLPCRTVLAHLVRVTHRSLTAAHLFCPAGGMAASASSMSSKSCPPMNIVLNFTL